MPSSGNGQLERSELATLLRDFLGAGKLTTADVSYFTAMLDLEGNNSVSEEEFMAVAKDFLDIEKRAASGVAAEEVWYALNALSTAMQRDKVGGWCGSEMAADVSTGLADTWHTLTLCPGWAAPLQESGYAMFRRLDADGDGKLDHKEVGSLIRSVVPEIRTREVSEGRASQNPIVAVQYNV